MSQGGGGKAKAKGGYRGARLNKQQMSLDVTATNGESCDGWHGPTRLDIAGGWYHVLNRGVEKRANLSRAIQ